ncbi:MAG: hypothetical protein Q4B65_00230 [Candidatus Saccharibacteria bacterium]|nr:hypothetical protein [Candidatus Saccharibacteria bacterium]
MRIRKGISFYCSILLMFCQVFLCCSVFAVEGFMPEDRNQAVSEHCETIRANLQRVQREDSVVRTHIGPYYNTVLEKFMKPLNLRLVENSLNNTGLLENQSVFAAAQGVFRDDYSEYQRGLSELVLMNCASEPEKFYAKLEEVREKRKTVAEDVKKMRRLVSEQVVLVEKLRSEL